MKPIRTSYLTFGAPDVGQPEIDQVVDSMRSGWLSTGKKVAQFESLVSSYIGSRFAKALNSCTAALHLSLIASGIGPGDEVITSPITFAATANVIVHIGAKPVFVDVDKSTGNINPTHIARAITKKTRAIIPIHLYGRPCEMDEIMSLAQKHNLVVIEDAAHAFGATYKGKKIGTIGDFTCFSFYVTKNLVTGEGGMVTTNNKKASEIIEQYGLHGMSRGAWKRYSDHGFKHYTIVVPGFKYNMMDLQAGMGIVQLSRFEAMQRRRKEIWKTYMKELSDLPVILPPPVPNSMTHALHLFTILVDKKRDEIVQALHKEGIGTGIHFISLHIHPYYKKTFGFKRKDFPNAINISDRTISLPLSSKLTNQDVSDVVAAVRKVIKVYTSEV